MALVGLIGLAPIIHAAVPALEQLLPADTVGLVSVPDWDKLVAYFEQSQFGQLWHDPVLKPFKDKLVKEFNDDVVVRLEKELGIKVADYVSLVHGQVTFAVIQDRGDGRSDRRAGVYLFIDVKDQAERLASQITELKKKWVDSGQQLKSEKIRNVEFITVEVRSEELSRTLEKVFPAPEDPDDAAKKAAVDQKDDRFEISFGQSESLLIIGNSLKDIEKVLVRQSGGTIPTLSDLPAFEANHSGLFRDALVLGWVHFKPIYESLIRQAAELAPADQPDSPMMPGADKILAALGLGGLETIAVKAGGSAEGTLGELFLGVPETNRQGIFKILVTEGKDSSPPPFVPASSVKFSRWRVDGQKAWATLEAMLAAISPEMTALVKMTLGTVGKDKDPDFDFKKSFIGNLGDDFIAYEKNPRSSTLADLNTAPALYLVGSPYPEKMAQALATSASIMPVAASEEPLKEREFLGRKIYSFPLPSLPGPGTKAIVKQSFSFAASAGYVAMSTDAALLEEYLRTSENTGKALHETSGLNEAAQKVGGMGTGFFAYENHGEGFRVVLETLKNDAAALNKIFSLTAAREKVGPAGAAQDIKEWLDPALLPPFDQVSKYFHIAVYGGNATAQGLSWKLFWPAPPQLRK